MVCSCLYQSCYIYLHSVTSRNNSQGLSAVFTFLFSGAHFQVYPNCFTYFTLRITFFSSKALSLMIVLFLLIQCLSYLLYTHSPFPPCHPTRFISRLLKPHCLSLLWLVSLSRLPVFTYTISWLLVHAVFFKDTQPTTLSISFFLILVFIQDTTARHTFHFLQSDSRLYIGH